MNGLIISIDFLFRYLGRFAVCGINAACAEVKVDGLPFFSSVVHDISRIDVSFLELPLNNVKLVVVSNTGALDI